MSPHELKEKGDNVYIPKVVHASGGEYAKPSTEGISNILALKNTLFVTICKYSHLF